MRPFWILVPVLALIGVFVGQQLSSGESERSASESNADPSRDLPGNPSESSRMGPGQGARSGSGSTAGAKPMADAEYKTLTSDPVKLSRLLQDRALNPEAFSQRQWEEVNELAAATRAQQSSRAQRETMLAEYREVPGIQEVLDHPLREVSDAKREEVLGAVAQYNERLSPLVDQLDRSIDRALDLTATERSFIKHRDGDPPPISSNCQGAFQHVVTSSDEMGRHYTWSICSEDYPEMEATMQTIRATFEACHEDVRWILDEK